jgi:hypothetical protein
MIVLATSLLLQGLLVSWAHRVSDQHLAQAHRLPNPMAYPDAARTAVVRNFITRVAEQPNNVMVLGDSQPYGFQISEDRIFSSLLDTDKPAWNLAFEDARVGDTAKTLDLLAEANTSIDTIILNINPGHAKRPDFVRIPEEGQIRYTLGLWRNPLAYLDAIRRIDQHPNPTTLTVRKDPAYFNELDTPAYWTSLDALFQQLSETRAHVLIYVSPHAERVMAANQYDRAAIDAFTQRVQTLCAKSSIQFLPLESRFVDGDFFDIAHLNQRGHAKLAKLVDEALE